MVTLVIGGSGSGKSAYAEDLLQAVMDEKYYLATMQVYDVEMQKKVDIHRRNRAGKGFQTIEKPVDKLICQLVENCFYKQIFIWINPSSQI